jgi:hypothetical protein
MDTQETDGAQTAFGALQSRSDYFERMAIKEKDRADMWRLAFWCLFVFAVLCWVYSHHFYNPDAGPDGP